MNNFVFYNFLETLKLLRRFIAILLFNNNLNIIMSAENSQRILKTKFTEMKWH